MFLAFKFSCYIDRSAVHSVSVHPSGKLALTVGADRSLHTWNLITGRSAFITNIKQGNYIVLYTVRPIKRPQNHLY